MQTPTTPAAPAPATGQPPSTAPTAARAPRFYPPETRTGRPELDQVIDATLKGQIATLESLVTMVPVRCHRPSTGAEVPPEPLCPDGQASGTLTPAFAHDTCEAHYETDPETARLTINLNLRAPLGLRAVYPLSRTEEAGVYAIQFITKETGEPRSLYVNAAGRIIGVQIGCGTTIVNKQYLLAPPR